MAYLAKFHLSDLSFILFENSAIWRRTVIKAPIQK